MRGVYNLPFLRNFLGPRIRPTEADIVAAVIGEDVFQNFSNAYFNLLGAIAENDLNFIGNVCHADIFAKLREEMQIVSQNNLQIRLCSDSDINAEDGQVNNNENSAKIESRYWESSDTQMDVAAFALVGLSMATRH